MALVKLTQLQSWSSRMGLINGVLFSGFGIRFGLEAWTCPTADALAFSAVMLALGGSSLVDYFGAGRDRIAAMTWCHALGFAALVGVAARNPEPMYITAAVAWGLLSLMGPVMALRRPEPAEPKDGAAVPSVAL